MGDSHVAESLDRLSELPNSLILSVLSLLPIKDAIRTTILSTRWKDVWTTVPCLHFKNRSDYDSDKFRNFVYSALAQWKGANIHKLRIEFLFRRFLTSYVDSLLLFAMLKKVEELCIELTEYEYGWYNEEIESKYQAIQCLYSCQFLTKLTLAFVQLNIRDGERVRWNLLKSLSIEKVDSITDNAMNQIISGAPLLEFLNLQIKEIKESLNVRSTSLKTLKIELIQSGFCILLEAEIDLGIWAPNLENLELWGVTYTRCSMNVPSLKNASFGFDKVDNLFLEDTLHFMSRKMWINALLSIAHVEKLTLANWLIELLLEMMQEIYPTFSNVKFLKLYPFYAEGMLDVLTMFPKLVKLIVECNELVQDEEHKDIKFDTCTLTILVLFRLQLKTVEIAWPCDDDSIIAMVEILLHIALVLEEMVLRLRTRGANPETFNSVREKVLSMPRYSPYAEVIVIED